MILRRGAHVLLAALLFLAPSLPASQKSKGWSTTKSIPKRARQEFTSQHYDAEYDITYQLYPSYLTGDFNGDGRSDDAILVHHRSSGKFGIAIIHGKWPQAIHAEISILGAGKKLGTAGSDFKWMKIWHFIDMNKPDLHPSLMKLQEDAIEAGTPDGKKGVIFWDGKNYTWQETHK